MSHLLITGFPGVLADRLLPLLLEDTDRTATALVHPSMADRARTTLSRLEKGVPVLKGRVRLVEGDLIRPGVVSDLDELERPSQVFHLAALYHLGAAREPAVAVNAKGTEHVLSLVRRLGSVERFHHVSTCYVSGRFPGTFHETDLDRGQDFGNHYEETKYLAEVAVRQEEDISGIPVTVYRPTIVAGDSTTGEAGRFDGPYYVFAWIRMQPSVALVPRVPGTSRASLNVVPVDWVVRAMAALADRDDTARRTFHLADPSPLHVPEFMRLAGKALGRRTVGVPVPAVVARGLLAAVSRLHPFLPSIPGEAVDYLSHPTSYGTGGTLPLLDTMGLTPPAFSDYVKALARYFEARWADRRG